MGKLLESLAGAKNPLPALVKALPRDWVTLFEFMLVITVQLRLHNINIDDPRDLAKFCQVLDDVGFIERNTKNVGMFTKLRLNPIFAV